MNHQSDAGHYPYFFFILSEYLASIAERDTSENMRNQMPASQVIEEENITEGTQDRPSSTTTSELPITTSPMPTPAPGRNVGSRGTNGVFGFMVGSKFYLCDKPKYLERDQWGNQVLPSTKDYYRRCQYWDRDPRRHFQRQVGKLGRNGYFGYFEGGRWVECAPPAYLDHDEADPNIYYIPLDLGYEPKCQYFGYNVSKLFDASDDAAEGATPDQHCPGLWSVLLPLIWTISRLLVWILKGYVRTSRESPALGRPLYATSLLLKAIDMIYIFALIVNRYVLVVTNGILRKRSFTCL